MTRRTYPTLSDILPLGIDFTKPVKIWADHRLVVWFGEQENKPYREPSALHPLVQLDAELRCFK